MSFDTKYRPKTYAEVLGQDGIVKILREFIRAGKGRQQSYLFAGPYGSGKTTLGRIFARALLCSSPSPEGDPCDSCVSCTSLLTYQTAEGYVEVDAATNSGKDQMRKVTEEIQFSTFSGRQRIYLFDESHQLSKDALDALLKPLEDNVPGTSDKQLVCIFCTTEPEKMRATILSRCAPVFVVQPVSPANMATRLSYVCQKEGLTYEESCLPIIAEITECHFRDALKALEGISMLGPVNVANVATYLHMDLNGLYLDVLENLGRDVNVVLDAVAKLLDRRSPVTIYERLAEDALRAYQHGLGAIRLEAFRDGGRLKKLAEVHGINLLVMTARFADRPAKAASGALKLDLLQLHAQLASGQVLMPNVVATPTVVPLPVTKPAQLEPMTSTPVTVEVAPKPKVGTVNTTTDYGESEVKFAEKAKKRRVPSEVVSADASVAEIPIQQFCWLLARRVSELSEGVLGSARHPNVDSP